MTVLAQAFSRGNVLVRTGAPTGTRKVDGDDGPEW